MIRRTVAILIVVVLAAITAPVRAAEKPNILFIPIDDLNHWVGHLGRNAQTRTPNIDRLAAMGVSFHKAYCAAPACNPSRIALMSGLRPSTSGCYDNSQDWRPYVSEDKLLNTVLMRAGYNTFGCGKLYHGSYGHGESWTEYPKDTHGEMTRHPSAQDDGVGGIKFCAAGV